MKGTYIELLPKQCTPADRHPHIKSNELKMSSLLLY